LLSKIGDSTSRLSLADYYLEFTGTKKGWAKKPVLVSINFSDSNSITPLQDSVLNLIYERIVNKNLEAQRTNKQNSIISVTVTTPNSIFSRLLSERLVDAAAKLYMDIRIGTAQKNIIELQKRSDSLLLLLNNKSYSTAASQQLDINPGIKTAIVPVEIATRDKTVLATLYAEVIKNLEAGKLMLSQQTPVIEVLDKPGYLLEDKRKGLAFLAIVVSMISGFLYVAAAVSLFLLFGIGANADSSLVQNHKRSKILQASS